MPTEFEWKTYHEWCKKFGTSSDLHCSYRSVRLSILMLPCIDTDILHLSVMGTNIIVLDSPEAVLELMERKSSIYSDRYVVRGGGVVCYTHYGLLSVC